MIEMCLWVEIERECREIETVCVCESEERHERTATG